MVTGWLDASRGVSSFGAANSNHIFEVSVGQNKNNNNAPHVALQQSRCTGLLLPVNL
jgi:hypothetical protein